MSSQTHPNAMAFFHPDGLAAAHGQASAFAGNGGRIATLPDIIDARLATRPGDAPWEQYFTTTSAEYVGLSRGGNPIAVVAHGIGPMATLEGMVTAYRHEFSDQSRRKRGGRISQADFLKLESGGFGEVEVVDLAATWARREYQFSGHAVTRKEIGDEPLWRARLGKRWMEYCQRHESFARDWSKENGVETGGRPCILSMDGASNCSYFDRKILDCWLTLTPDTAVAHLLSIGQLVHSHHQYHERDYRDSERRVSLSSDVSCHEWGNGTRFAGIRGTESANGIHPGIGDIRALIEKRWKDLLVPADVTDPEPPLRALMRVGNETFTQIPKVGERMDTYEPEFLVTRMERVGGTEPTTFKTTIGGYHGFFKYGIEEMQCIAPRGANAYLIPGEVQIQWNGGNPTHHVATVEFYRVEIDRSKRLLRSSEIYADTPRLLSLVEPR